MELIDIFESLVKIPSPSLKEDKVADFILKTFQDNGIFAKKDSYGNVYARIEATDNTKKPFMLSSHMDVIGDDSPINTVYKDGFIQTDKSRTLGADDKAGVAAAMKLMLYAKEDKTPHGALEVTFTKDEENSMTGIDNVEFDKIESKNVLVLDSDKLGNFEISGAGYTKLTLSVTTPYGGHSGIDIDDEKRLNAAKLIAELVCEIPQGVYLKNELGVITSINIGSIVAGGVDNSIYQAVENNIKRADAAYYVCSKSMSNLINTKAYAHYSLRSSDKKAEGELIEKIKEILDKFNAKYKDLAHAKLEIEEHLPIFNKSDDTTVIEIAKKAGEISGVKVNVSSFHAGAETHIYANKKNKNNETFSPYLIGVADIYNMHSADEMINVESFKSGYKFLEEFFRQYNQ